MPTDANSKLRKVTLKEKLFEMQTFIALPVDNP